MIDEFQKNSEWYEQIHLSNLEFQNREITSEVVSFSENIKNSVNRSQDMLDMIGRLYEYRRYFLFHEDVAKYLVEEGKPQLSKRLNEILTDLQETLQIFNKTYEEMLDENKEIV